MPFFRKKPVVIEAHQWWGWEEHADGDLHVCVNNDDPTTGLIDTLEGAMIVRCGDWIVEGVKGELYPCKPDIFEATYEEVTEGVTDPVTPEGTE